MTVKPLAVVQAAGLFVGLAFMGFAVASIDVTGTGRIQPATASVAPSVKWTSQSSTPIAAPTAEDDVTVRIDAFRNAMIAADVPTLELLSDDALSFGHSNGVIQTKRDFIRMVASGDEIFNSVELTDRTLTRAGDMALERHTFIADILVKGKPMTVSLKVLEVWRRRDHGWMLVARQAFAI